MDRSLTLKQPWRDSNPHIALYTAKPSSVSATGLVVPISTGKLLQPVGLLNKPSADLDVRDVTGFLEIVQPGFDD